MPTLEIVDRVWGILETLGADAASKPHFIRRWERSPDWFGFALQDTDFTFLVQGGRWRVTSCSQSDAALIAINDALELMRRETTTTEEAA